MSLFQCFRISKNSHLCYYYAVIRVNHLSIRLIPTSYVQFQRLNTSNFAPYGNITELQFSPNVGNTSQDNILAYRPNFSDGHQSYLATFFVNLDSLFLCIRNYTSVLASCKLYPNEDDGFRGGRPFVETSDDGTGKFKSIFGKGTHVYAFALAGCSQFNLSCTNIHLTMDLRLVCILPGALCSVTD